MNSDENVFRVAFGGGRSREGVLDRIERLAGRPSRVYLPEPPGEPSPVVKIGGGALDDSRYQIAGEIARGGVGVVYRGRDKDLGRDVALKVLLERHRDSSDVVERFIEEAQIGAQLQHPGIVPVYGIGLQPDGRPFISMKLIKGRTLAALLREREDPGQDRRRFLRIFEQACQTVAYAHSRGVIHRDLKPSNIMVGAFGEVLVVDWGFAKVLGRAETEGEAEARTVIATVRTGGERSDSISGSVMGTPAYMPPEQALGHVETLDERADVFALGSIFAELLTGKPAYTARGSDALVLAAQARLEDAFARLAVSHADPSLIDLAKHCLSPLSEDRPADASVVATSVHDHLAQVEQRARDAELASVEEQESLKRERKRAIYERRTKRMTIGLAALILVAVGAIGFVWQRRENERADRLAKVSRAVATAIDEARTLRSQGRTDAAVGSARKAVALAGDTLARPRAIAALEQAEAAKQKVDEAAARDIRETTLLTEVATVRGMGLDFSAQETRYAEAFRRYGLDPAMPDPGLFEREEIIDALHLWLVAARFARGFSETADPEGIERIADRVDPDELRAKLRRGDREGLLGYAKALDVKKTAPGPLYFLIHALQQAGEPIAATHLAIKARRAHPGDFGLSYSAAVFCNRFGVQVEALRAARSCTSLQPERDYAWQLLATVLSAERRHVDAAKAMRRAIELAPDNAQLRRGLVRILKAASLLEERIKTWRASSTGPERYQLGYALMKMGRFKEALSEFEAAEAQGFRYGVLYQAIGRIHLARREFEPAREAFRKGVSAKELSRGEAYHWLGYVAASIGPDLAAAAEWFDREYAGATRAERAHFFNGAAAAYPAERAKDRALEAARRCHESAPHISRYQGELGDALVVAGQIDEGVRLLRGAIERDPGNSGLHSRLGRALWRAGQHEQAAAALRKTVELSPTNEGSHFDLIWCCFAGGLEPPFEFYERFAKETPSRYLGLVWKGACLRHNDHLTEAIEVYQAAAKIKSSYEVHLGLAALFWRKGDLDRSEAHLKQAKEIEPDRNSVLLLEAELHARRGRRKEAESVLAKLVSTRLVLDFGRVYGFLLRQTRSLEEVIEARRKLPGDFMEQSIWEVRIGATDYLFAEGKLDEAIEALKQCEQTPLITRNLALALWRKGDLDGALEAIDRADKALKVTAHAGYGYDDVRAEILRARGEFKTAEAAGRSGWKQLTCLPTHGRNAISWRRARGRLRLLIDECERFAKGEPETAIDRARYHFFKRRYAEAARWFEQAFRDDPNLADDLESENRFLAARAAAGAGRSELARKWVSEERAAWAEQEEPARALRYAPITAGYREWMLRWAPELRSSNG